MLLKTHRIAHSRNSGKYLFIIFMTLLQYLTVGIGTAGTDGIPTAGGDKHPHMPDTQLCADRRQVARRALQDEMDEAMTKNRHQAGKLFST